MTARHKLFLFVGFWLLYINVISPNFVDLGGDSSQYVILAQALADGKGFRMVNYPGEPLCTYYPPLFPLILSSILYLFGRNFLLMHLMVVVFGFFSLLLIYKILAKHSQTAAFLSVVFLGLNSSFIFFMGEILSDIPFLFFSVFTLFMLVRYREDEKIFTKEGVLLAAGAVLSYLCRYIGLVLFLGVILSLLIDKDYRVNKERAFKKAAFIGSIFLLVFVLWSIRGLLNPNPYTPPQLKQFFFINPYAVHKGTLFEHPLYFIHRFMEGANFYYYNIGEILFAYPIKKTPFLREPMCLFSSAMVFLGLWQSFRKKRGCVFEFYFLLYFLAIIVWPFREARFILPIIPFIFFYLLEGLENLSNLAVKKAPSICFSSLIVVILVFNLLFTAKAVWRQKVQTTPLAFRNFFALHNWMKENIPNEDGVVFSRKPTLTYFYTDKKSICYPFSPNPDVIWESALKERIKYIIIDEFSLETSFYMGPFLFKYKDRLNLLFRQGDSGVFEVSLGSGDVQR